MWNAHGIYRDPVGRPLWMKMAQAQLRPHIRELTSDEVAAWLDRLHARWGVDAKAYTGALKGLPRPEGLPQPTCGDVPRYRLQAVLGVLAEMGVQKVIEIRTSILAGFEVAFVDAEFDDDSLGGVWTVEDLSWAICDLNENHLTIAGDELLKRLNVPLRPRRRPAERAVDVYEDHQEELGFEAVSGPLEVLEDLPERRVKEKPGTILEVADRFDHDDLRAEAHRHLDRMTDDQLREVVMLLRARAG